MDKGASFTITPKVVEIRTPTGTVETTREGVADFLQSVADLARGTVVDKMRRGVSPEVVSEQGSVGVRVGRSPNPVLVVYSYDVRAAIDEKGRRAGPLPPFGFNTALREWAEFFLNTTDYKRVRGLAIAIAQRGQPAPTDVLGLNKPFTRALEELRPVFKEGLARTKQEIIAEINKPPAKGGPVRPRRSPLSGWRRGK